MVLFNIEDSSTITMSCDNGQLRSGKGITMSCDNGQLRSGKGITMSCDNGQLRSGKGIEVPQKTLVKTMKKVA